MRGFCLMVLVGATFFGSNARKEEPAKGVRFTEFKRETAVKQVKRIALIPPVVVLRFDVKGRLPSPDRFTIRRAVANELAPAVRELLSQRLDVALNESVAAALAEEGLKPVNLFRTAKGADEVLRDRRKNVCRLEMTRTALEADPLAVTVYHYVPEALRNMPKDDDGLATLARGVNPRLNPDSVRKILPRLKADALLLLRVEDLDTKEGVVAIPPQKYKSSVVTVHAALVSASDLSVLWEAELQGHSSTRERKIPFAQHGIGYNKAEDRLALDGMTKLIPVLAEKLIEAVKG